MQNLEDVLDCSTTDLVNDIEFSVSTSMEIIISDLYQYETDLMDDLLNNYHKMESIKIIYEIKIALIKRELNVLQPYQLTALWLKTVVGKEQYNDIEDLYYDMSEIINYVYNQINFYRFSEHTEINFLKLLNIFKDEELKRETKLTTHSIPQDCTVDVSQHIQREKIDQSVIENTNDKTSINNILSGEKKNDIWKEWWRWLLLPFVSVGGAYVAFYLFMLIQYIHPANTSGYLSFVTMVYIIPTVGKAIFGYVFGLLSYTIAPRGKMIASTVMITLMAIITLLNIFISWNNQNFSLAIKIQVIVADSLLILGAIYGAKKADKDH